MAIKAVLETSFGETRELYVRLNNFDTVSKHALSIARFRGFLSQEYFEAGKQFVWEKEVEFMADLSGDSRPIGQQAYTALKSSTPEIEGCSEA